MIEVTEAIRQELLRLLGDAPISGGVLARVSRIAGIGARLVGTSAGDAVAGVLADPSADAGAPELGDVAETTGVRVMQEMIAAAPRLIQQYGDSADKLTEAIRNARRHGMTDVSEELEKRLAGRALDTACYVEPKMEYMALGSQAADLPDLPDPFRPLPLREV